MDAINSLLNFWFGGLSNEQKIVCSIIGAIIAASGYTVSVVQTYRGKSYPNPMSWMGFGLLTLVGAWVQHESGAGVGTWTMDVTVVGSFAQGVASLCFKPGGWHWSDFPMKAWAALFLGVACFAAFMGSTEIGLTALGAAVLATASDLFTYGPAIVSSWKDPWGENVFSYSMQSLKNVFAIAALATISPENWLYAMMLLWMNGPLMIGYFMIRRVFVPRPAARQTG